MERIELGAMWGRVSERTGNEYFTGDFKTPDGQIVKFIAFRNDRKTSDKHPDFRFYLQEERSSGGYDNGGGYSNRQQYSPRGNYQQNSGYGNSGRRYDGQPSHPQEERRTPPANPPASKIEYPTEDIDPDDIPF